MRANSLNDRWSSQWIFVRAKSTEISRRSSAGVWLAGLFRTDLAFFNRLRMLLICFAPLVDNALPTQNIGRLCGQLSDLPPSPTTPRVSQQLEVCGGFEMYANSFVRDEILPVVYHLAKLGIYRNAESPYISILSPKSRRRGTSMLIVIE